jgi:hypothetical protein
LVPQSLDRPFTTRTLQPSGHTSLGGFFMPRITPRVPLESTFAPLPVAEVTATTPTQHGPLGNPSRTLPRWGHDTESVPVPGWIVVGDRDSLRGGRFKPFRGVEGTPTLDRWGLGPRIQGPGQSMSRETVDPSLSDSVPVPTMDLPLLSSVLMGGDTCPDYGFLDTTRRRGVRGWVGPPRGLRLRLVISPFPVGSRMGPKGPAGRVRP